MLVLSEDQRMLMESARGAVAANAPIAAFRKLRAESSGDGFSRAFWRQCAEMGWTGVLVPEAFGGIDFGVVGAGLIAREMARTLAPSPFLSTSVMAASALRRGGSTAQKSIWLPRIAGGEVIVGCALDEGARRASPPIKAFHAGPGWRLAGVQHMALDGHVADAFLIAAQVENAEATFFLVGAEAKGLARDARTLVDSRRVATLSLDNVSLDKDAALAGGAATIEVDNRHRARGRCGGALRRRRGSLRADDGLSQGASTVRPQDRQLPGAAASRGANARRYREFLVGDAEGDGIARDERQ